MVDFLNVLKQRIYFRENIANAAIANCIVIAMCFIPASLTTYIIKERITKEKGLQHVYGVGTTMYWTAAFLWDMVSDGIFDTN